MLKIKLHDVETTPVEKLPKEKFSIESENDNTPLRKYLLNGVFRKMGKNRMKFIYKENLGKRLLNISKDNLIHNCIDISNYISTMANSFCKYAPQSSKCIFKILSGNTIYLELIYDGETFKEIIGKLKGTAGLHDMMYMKWVKDTFYWYEMEQA